MLAMHGYVNPTLIDGLTKPHNPGLEYDIFAQLEPAPTRRERGGLRGSRPEPVTVPVNDYGANGGQQANVSATPDRSRPRVGTTVTVTTTAQPWPGRRADTSRSPAVSVFDYDGRVRGHVRAGREPVHLRARRDRPGRRPAGPSSPAPRPRPRAGTTGVRSTPRPTAPTSGSTARPSRCAATPPAAAGSAPRPPSTSGFYSSADFWLTNRADILHDQLVDRRAQRHQRPARRLL